MIIVEVTVQRFPDLQSVDPLLQKIIALQSYMKYQKNIIVSLKMF